MDPTLKAAIQAALDRNDLALIRQLVGLPPQTEAAA